jgi:glutathione S-transferase
MQLLEFPHSHYCEKARWALDHKGIPYERVSIMPGLHIRRLKKIVPGTSVPVLLDGDTAIQGSSSIIDYLDREFPESGLTPTDESEKKECRRLEEEFDQCFGVHLRRTLYFHLLPHPAFVRHCFMSRSPWYERWMFAAAYPLLRSRVAEVYGVHREEVEQGLAEMMRSLDHWDAILLPGKFLVGDRFSRADLSLASMLYFAGLPTEFESPWPRATPTSAVEALLQSLADRPTILWVESIYRSHRKLNRSDTGPLISL